MLFGNKDGFGRVRCDRFVSLDNVGAERLVHSRDRFGDFCEDGRNQFGLFRDRLGKLGDHLRHKRLGRTRDRFGNFGDNRRGPLSVLGLVDFGDDRRGELAFFRNRFANFGDEYDRFHC